MKSLRYQRRTNDRKRVPGLLRSARNDETDVSQRSPMGEADLTTRAILSRLQDGLPRRFAPRNDDAEVTIIPPD